MKRRAFLKTTTAMAGLAGAGTVSKSLAAERSGAPKREYYELRTYTLTDAGQGKLVEEYLTKAFIPGLNRLGIRPVGAFAEREPSANPLLYALVPYASPDQAATTMDKLLADPVHRKAGAAYLEAEAKNPAYVRIESWLLCAFAGMPKLEVPRQAAKGKPRILQLRTYESCGELAGKKKIEMFNGSEIDIFRRVGLTPVFFGETIIGGRRPNLTYMLVFDDIEAHDQAWGTFRADSEWLKLKAIPEYADAKIVSKISKTLLVPLPGSQI